MKEELPSILISDGWETDENGKLVEVVIPNTVETYQAPTKIKFFGETLNYLPSTAAALQEIDCPNLTAVASNSYFANYSNLTKASLDNITSLVNLPSGSNLGVFRGCTLLNTISMAKLTSIGTDSSTSGGHFFGCTSLVNVNMPLLQTIGAVNYDGSATSGHFNGCTSLTTLILPSLSSIGGAGKAAIGNFAYCTSLTTVQLGSEGHPVTSIGNYTFGNCTQAGLTITIYTQGGAALSGEKWGATNATIVYKTA